MRQLSRKAEPVTAIEDKLLPLSRLHQITRGSPHGRPALRATIIPAGIVPFDASGMSPARDLPRTSRACFARAPTPVAIGQSSMIVDLSNKRAIVTGSNGRNRLRDCVRACGLGCDGGHQWPQR